MSYAQWVSVTIRTKVAVVIKNTQIKWGKFYDGANGDKDKSVGSPNGTTIQAGGKFTFYSCGREDSASGTEGSIDIYTEKDDKKIGMYVWDCPWSGKNSSNFYSEGGKYEVALSGANINSGALGNITLSILEGFD